MDPTVGETFSVYVRRPQGLPLQDALAELKALATIINNSITTIEKSITETSSTYPSPRTVPFSAESEAGRNIPEVRLAGANIVSAASQLISMVRPPPLTLVAYTTQFHVSTALRIATTTHTAEILRESGTQGKHVKDIAGPTGVDPAKLARILRLLATNHVFTEVSPDVFANNRLSSMLDTGKDVAQIIADPDRKYEGAIAFGALLEHLSDDAFKCSTSLLDVIVDPSDGLSNEPNRTAFNQAFKTDLPFFEWLDQPQQARRLARFGIAMDGGARMVDPGLILRGLNWQTYPEGSLIVDVGGGIGSRCVLLAKNHPQLRFAIQDRAPVVREAVKYWTEVLPDYYKTGKVLLEGGFSTIRCFVIDHNLSTRFLFSSTRSQSVCVLASQDPSRLVGRFNYCVKILRNLRAAADESTKLLVVDNIVSYACSEHLSKEIPGVERPPPPAPLLPNFGHAGVLAYYTDLTMMSLVNGQERTVLQLQALMKESGWKLVEVHYGDPFAGSQSKAIGVPA
ncbi:S-adenosyl-L-methionine-dependent methyltransferase [Mycena galericulata]|nr:S-adenosyl-L-methionine-dependent methyltransferase [Mycena galericulata]